MTNRTLLKTCLALPQSSQAWADLAESDIKDLAPLVSAELSHEQWREMAREPAITVGFFTGLFLGIAQAPVWLGVLYVVLCAGGMWVLCAALPGGVAALRRMRKGLRPLSAHSGHCVQVSDWLTTIPAVVDYRDKVLARGRQLLHVDFLAMRGIAQAHERALLEQRGCDACQQIHKMSTPASAPAASD